MVSAGMHALPSLVEALWKLSQYTGSAASPRPGEGEGEEEGLSDLGSLSDISGKKIIPGKKSYHWYFDIRHQLENKSH